MAQSPETIRHRRRVGLPTLLPGPTGKLGVVGQQLGANGDLQSLLEELVSLAQKDVVFTATLEPDRLLLALGYAGYAFPVFINVEDLLAPLATVTTYLAVPDGWTFVVRWTEYWNSLPWNLTSAFWVDSDVPAPPTALFIRTPDHLHTDFPSLVGANRFIRYTVTNNHAINTAYFCGAHYFWAMTVDTMKMVEAVYEKPLIDYVREQAEKIAGRPFP